MNPIEEKHRKILDYARDEYMHATITKETAVGFIGWVYENYRVISVDVNQCLVYVSRSLEVDGAFIDSELYDLYVESLKTTIHLPPCVSGTIRNLILEKSDSIPVSLSGADEAARLIISAEHLGMESLARDLKIKHEKLLERYERKT